MTVFALVAAGVCALVAVGLYLHNRRLLSRLAAIDSERAEAVRAALSAHTLVDDIALPKPDDARWARIDITRAGGDAVPLLRIGELYVAEGTLYFGRGTTGHITRETKTYCAAVWKAYRARIAQNAIETKT